jgi:hypothetical protein
MFDKDLKNGWRLRYAEFVSYPCGNASARRGKMNVKFAAKWINKKGAERGNTWNAPAESIPAYMLRFARAAGLKLNDPAKFTGL